MAKQLESIINYFEKNTAEFAANPQNTPDLYAALDNYFTIMMAIKDPAKGDASNALGNTMYSKMKNFYDRVVPKLYAETKTLAGEDSQYLNWLDQLQMNLDAIGIQYGILKAPANQVPAQVDPSAMQMQQMMNQQVQPDSVLE